MRAARAQEALAQAQAQAQAQSLNDGARGRACNANMLRLGLLRLQHHGH